VYPITCLYLIILSLRSHYIKQNTNISYQDFKILLEHPDTWKCATWGHITYEEKTWLNEYI
jgi:hypothetical protein